MKRQAGSAGGSSGARRVKPQDVKTSKKAKLSGYSGAAPSAAKMGSAYNRRAAQQKRDAVKRGSEGPKKKSR